MSEPITVEQFVESLTDQQLRCRTRNHHMVPKTVRVLRDRGRVIGYEQDLKCRCGTLRTEVLDHEGYVLKVHYNYSEAAGYLAQGLGRMTTGDRALMRVTSLTHFIDTTKGGA